MYLSKKYHPLTQTLFVTTGIQLLAEIIMTILRWYLRRKTGLPDMLDDRVWVATMIVDGIALLGMLVAIWFSMKKVRGIMRSVDEEDQVMMRRLQEDTFGKDLSALPADLIFKVLATWASILVGVGILQEIVTILYRRFAESLYSLYLSGDFTKKNVLTSIYNQTHGFKYLAMLVAILLGMLITGILLEDSLLIKVVIIAAVIFMIAFAVLDMTHFTIFGKKIGIVWTSAIFHALQTVGMVGFAVYLRVRFKGI